jgi:mono/diheme cytochrome c family protein
MRNPESYVGLLGAGTILSLAILVTFQLYQLREPARLAADEAVDRDHAIAAGEALYGEQCARCHGQNGEGLTAPALNSKAFLENVMDGQIFELIRTGIPGTAMPAWSQAFGGPLTGEQTRQIVAYIRSWEPFAQDFRLTPSGGDAQVGAEIYASTCFVCHGAQAEGTDLAPPLKDQERLSAFDDQWYRGAITEGRPSQGMPTWGTVLSPRQIEHLVALIAAWRQGQDILDAGGTPGGRGASVYAAYCASCHGENGEGGIGPPLSSNDFVREQTNVQLNDLILHGRTGTAMPGFQDRLQIEDVAAIVDLLRTWQR